jgi:hypothetical protein
LASLWPKMHSGTSIAPKSQYWENWVQSCQKERNELTFCLHTKVHSNSILNIGAQTWNLASMVTKTCWI